MRHILKYSIAFLGALVLAPVNMIAQDGGIVLDKKVIDNGDKTYTLTLETHTTGQTVKTVDAVATDFVLVLDNSGSMSSNTVTGRARVAPGTSLSYSTTYRYEIDGTLYYLKRVGTTGNRQWVYSTNSNPNAENKVGTLGTGNNYTVKVLDHIYTPNNSISRKQALLNACASFIESVYANNPTTGTKHHIAIVWYGQYARSGKTFSDYAFHELTESVRDNLITNFLNQTEIPNTGDNTFIDLGFEQAYNALYDARTDTRNKITVFFTDGEPGSNAGKFSEARARASIAQAVKLKSSALSNTVTVDGKSVTFPSKVFAVGLMTSGTANYHNTIDGNGSGAEVTNDKYRFMHYASSNYYVTADDVKSPYTFGYDLDVECLDPNCTITDDHHGSENPHGYFKQSDGSDLDDIFAEIASENAQTNEAVTEETTIVMDALTNMFKLPAGTQPENISLYTCSVWAGAPQVGSHVWETSATTTETSGKTVYKDKANNIVNAEVTEGHEEWWVKWEPWNDEAFTTEIAKDKDGNTIYYPDTTKPKFRYDSDGDTDVDIEDFITINKGKISLYPESDYLEVTGYNFAENFVGKMFNEDNQFEGWTGQKLIIQFNIEADPANTGGVTLDTNDSSSGVYVKDEDGTYTAIAEYISPVVNLPYIKIIKNGLGLRESATFNVLKINADGSTCMKSDGVTPEYEANIMISKTSDDTPFAIVKLLSAGYYKVTETTWAWAYTSTHKSDGLSGFEDYVKQMVLVDGNLTKDNCYLVFEFTNEPKTTAPDHAEALKQNNLLNNYAGGGTEDDDDDIIE